jgi:glutamate formiminotransferase
MRSRILLSVPNISEGRDAALIEALGNLISQPVRLLDTHSDADHNRSVFSFAGPPGELSEALMRLATKAVEAIDVMAPASSAGQHPHVGALDVAPLVYLRTEDRGAACAEALVVAERIGSELEVPVFLYGELTEDETAGPRTRAELRRGGVTALAARMSDARASQQPLRPDFGPSHLHPSAGATLIAARPPLVAFNLQLAPPATLPDAHRIASLIREGGEHGLPGLRAIGIELADGIAQVSMNVERPFELSLAEVVRAVAAHAPLLDAEIVALVPEAALDGFPQDLPIRGFDPARQVIEKALII